MSQYIKTPKRTMKEATLSESLGGGGGGAPPLEFWLKDSGVLDMDYFVKTLSDIKAKGVRPDLVGSIIAHYASKWVPELSESRDTEGEYSGNTSPESATATWRKKKFFVETLVGILPQEKDTIPCNFLLRLLRVSNMVGVNPTYRDELEKRVSWQFDEASLKELMIPAFSHTCATLLDVGLVRRLVTRFMGLDEGVRSSVALIKVAKLLDSYLAEAAVDSNLTLEDFIQLAGALPPHARSIDDGLYRAIDTYLKAHQGVTKQERKVLCRLIDTRKLTSDASMHASQNERLPVRAVIQVLFSEQSKLVMTPRQLDWSGPLGAIRSPSPSGLELPGRCLSKREVMAQQVEIRRLKEDVVRLQEQINVLQNQMDRVVEKKKGFFRWKRFSLVSGFKSVNESGRSQGIEERQFGEVGFGRHTPIPMDLIKTKLVKVKTPLRWRKSLS